MMGKKILLSALAAAFTITLSIDAQAVREKPADDFQAYDLGTIIVSAKQDKAKDIAITNEITAEDIKATNSHTVAEALSHAPGVRVTTGAKNQATVSIYGFEQSKILFMIDGVPFYETKFGILDLNGLSTDNIARIEIIKGAASVLYGANAMGGVVNIITKKPTEKPFTGASFEVSKNDTYRISATHGMKKGIFSYWLNYMYDKSCGWDLSDDFKPTVGTLTDQRYPKSDPKRVTSHIFEDGDERDNSDYKRQNFWAKFGIEPTNDSEYYINFHYLKAEKGVPSNTVSNNVFSRPVFSQFYADRIPEYDQWGLDLDGRQRLTNELTAKAKLFYHKHKDSLYSYDNPSFDELLAKSHYEDYMAGGTFILDYMPVSWDAIRLAFNYKGDSHKQVADEYLPYEKYFSYTGSVGLENEFNALKNLSVIFGISYDWFEVTEAKKNTTASNGDFISQNEIYKPDDDTVNGMIGANYILPDKTKVFASIARKSRFPTLNSLYNLIANGDPHLKSEKSVSYTLGASRMLGRFLKADFSVFYYEIDDKIARIGSGSSRKIVNIGEAEMTGCEIALEVYPLDDLILRADYTYNDAKDKSSNRLSNNLTDVPEHTANLTAQYTLPVVETRVDINASYMGSVYTNITPGSENELSGYLICNAKISRKFLKYYEVYIAANNIFDKDYEWGNGYPGQGRNLWTGVSVRF